MQKFNYKSVMQVRKLKKSLSTWVLVMQFQTLKYLMLQLKNYALISGQKPVVTRAKKSIAGFNLREGMPIGAKVTLRGERMYDFLIN